MKLRLALPAVCGLLLTAAALAAAGRVLAGPPPSLDGVTWDDWPVSYSGLHGKTVIVLAYGTWSEAANRGAAAEMLSQLKRAVAYKPAVVLAINTDKTSEKGPDYLAQYNFQAPNIVAGWDPLMPARLGTKADPFSYAWVDPEGHLVETGQPLKWFGLPTAPQFALTIKLDQEQNAGKFAALNSFMSARVRTLLWPLELGLPMSEADLAEPRSVLSKTDARALDAGIESYVEAQGAWIAQLARGELADRVVAYEQATLLASAFKDRPKAEPAKNLVAQCDQNKELRTELAAKRAYDKALEAAAQAPANRSRLLLNVSRSYQGTLYGQRAADEAHSAATAARPRSSHPWPELDEAQQAAALAEQHAFLETVRRKVPGRGLKLYETRRFLYFSDMPADVIQAQYLPYLDQMYEQLCGAFGLDPKKNIWKGKATIVAYADMDDFLNFESTFYHHAALGAQGIAHPGRDGTVRISCTTGDDLSYFAAVLVHETTHGFEWRYRSADDVPSWLNEGAAEWIASRVVSNDKTIDRKIQRAIQIMASTHSLGGNFFTAAHIDAWQYGAAADMTDFLLDYDPAAKADKPKTHSSAPAAEGENASGGSSATQPEAKRYRKLIDGIKDGLPWELALQEAYGLTPAQLVQAYGESIGIPDLTP